MFIITNGQRYGQRYERMKNFTADLEFHSSREVTQKSQKTSIFRHFSRRMEFQVGRGRARFIGRFIFFERGKGTT